jgi:hypothetical protein
VTSAYPFIAVPYMLDPSAELAGESEVAELLEKLAHCQRHNLWPAYGSGILPVSLPAWELARLGMNIEVSYA